MALRPGMAVALDSKLGAAGSAAPGAALPRSRICNEACVLGKHCYLGSCVPEPSGALAAGQY